MHSTMWRRVFKAIEVFGWLVLAGGLYYFVRIIILIRGPLEQLQSGSENIVLGILIYILLCFGPGLLISGIGRSLWRRSLTTESN